MAAMLVNFHETISLTSIVCGTNMAAVSLFLNPRGLIASHQYKEINQAWSSYHTSMCRSGYAYVASENQALRRTLKAHLHNMIVVYDCSSWGKDL